MQVLGELDFVFDHEQAHGGRRWITFAGGARAHAPACRNGRRFPAPRDYEFVISAFGKRESASSRFGSWAADPQPAKETQPTGDPAMHAKSLLVAAIALVAAAGASAQEAVYEQPQPVASATTRAAVVADLQQARANGTLLVTEADKQAWGPFVTTRSRAEVRAEVLDAAASGELQALHAETNSFDGQVAKRAAADASRVVAALR
ncbi:MAG: DUF4148 domain-containing protein [Burkholderiaceae bacterium]|nr:DUF4148 domain-containing protein [Burkholderiaceae bacterium]